MFVESNNGHVDGRPSLFSDIDDVVIGNSVDEFVIRIDSGRFRWVS
jgi:hypothetical protein